jgi:predicted DNA-binding mobile mystery protein A
MYYQMITPYEQLDERLETLRAVAHLAAVPPRGWIRAIRETLGMTTRQLSQRLGVSQPRVVKLEQSETTGAITLGSLQRAAEALGCRLVYSIVPLKPLTETIEERISVIAERQLASVEQTMRLEAQEVTNKARRDQARQQIVQEVMRRPARLWDEQ